MQAQKWVDWTPDDLPALGRVGEELLVEGRLVDARLVMAAWLQLGGAHEPEAEEAPDVAG